MPERRRLCIDGLAHALKDLRRTPGGGISLIPIAERFPIPQKVNVRTPSVQY